MNRVDRLMAVQGYVTLDGSLTPSEVSYLRGNYPEISVREAKLGRHSVFFRSLSDPRIFSGEQELLALKNTSLSDLIENKEILFAESAKSPVPEQTPVPARVNERSPEGDSAQSRYAGISHKSGITPQEARARLLKGVDTGRGGAGATAWRINRSPFWG